MSAPKNSSPLRLREKGRRAPFRIVAVYLLFSVLWIILSDRLLALLIADPEKLTSLQTAKGLFFVIATSLLLFWLIRRSLAAAEAKDLAIREIFAGISAVTGEDFFQTLVTRLTQMLQCDHALVGELTPEQDAVTTLAVCSRGRKAENFTYSLPGTPCANVFAGDMCVYRDGVAKLFPTDPLLQQMGVAAYIGAPVLNGGGRPIGILVVMDGGPFRETEWFEEVFRIFAQRAAAELERKRAEEALRAGERALQEQFNQLVTIFDALNALVYVADMEDNRLLFVNRYGETLFGSDWRERTCYEVLQQGQSTVCSFCTNDQLVRDGEPQSPCIWEFRNTRNRRWYQCTDKAIRWTDGRLVRMEVAVDITEHKELDRLKEEMLSAVSHEMRTPLTAMLGYLDFLLENEVGREQRLEFLQTIHRQTERLNDLIGTSLELQRLRAGDVVLGAFPADIKEIFEEVRVLFLSEQGRHRFVIDCPPDLPRVFGNREQLVQVVNHLVANAVKFSPAGGSITLGARDEDGTVTLRVADEGIGIGSEDLEKIFESFYRVDNADSRAAGGAGLGLTLVREIVRLHGGQVWAESRLGEGSTFYIRLPAVPPKNTDDS